MGYNHNPTSKSPKKSVEKNIMRYLRGLGDSLMVNKSKGIATIRYSYRVRTASKKSKPVVIACDMKRAVGNLTVAKNRHKKRSIKKTPTVSVIKRPLQIV